MKAQTRMIVASVVVIALALTAVSGITYSWFSDTDKMEITVSTGKVDVGLDVVSLKDESTTDHINSTTTDITSDYSFGVSATAKVTTNNDSKAVTLSNLADKDAVKIGIGIVNKSTIATVYRVYTTYDGELSEYVTATIETGDTKSNDVSPWIKASAIGDSKSETLAGASVTIEFDSNGKENGTEKTATITLNLEAYQENTTELPEFTVTKKVTSTGTNVSQKFENGNTDVKSMEVSFTPASVGDYSISSTTVADNNSYTIQRTDTKTTNEVLSGISVAAKDSSGKVNLDTQNAILTFILGSSMVNSEKTGLADAISIVHKKSDGTTESVELKAAEGDLDAKGEYKLTDNNDGTYTLKLYVTGFSSYLVVADADVYVSDDNGKKTYYKTLNNALTPNGTFNDLKWEDTRTLFSGNVTLLRDVELTEENTTQGFAGILNGNGHMIVLKTDTDTKTKYSLFGNVAGPTVVMNLKYKTVEGEGVSLFYHTQSDLTFDNVEVLETTMKTSGNNSAFISLIFDGSVVFKNCINRANHYSDEAGAYSGLFVGGRLQSGTSASFINCVNYGDMSVEKGGIYIGNATNITSDANNITVTVTNCVNYGTIEYTSCGPYIGALTADSKYIEIAEKGTRNEGSFINLYDKTMKLNETTDGLSIIKASNLSVVSYKVSYTTWAKIAGGVGTWKTTVSLNVDPDNCTAKKYAMYDSDTYSKLQSVTAVNDTGWIKVDDDYSYQIVDDKYIVVKYNIGAHTLTINGVTPTPYLSAYDSSGKIVASVAMTALSK